MTTTDKNNSIDEDAIRALIDGFANAIGTRDIDGVMSVFAPEVVSFDFGPPLEHGGGETFVNRWQELLEAYASPISYELRELVVVADDSVAFSHSLNHISGVMMNGKTTDRWLRWTACYRKISGRWLIVHEHVSVPADLATGRALLDLKP